MDHLHLLFGALCLDEGEVEARSMLAFSLVIGTTSWPPTTAPAATPTCSSLPPTGVVTHNRRPGMHITAAHRRRSDGTCPAIHDTDDPALTAMQGAP